MYIRNNCRITNLLKEKDTGLANETFMTQWKKRISKKFQPQEQELIDHFITINYQDKKNKNSYLKLLVSIETYLYHHDTYINKINQHHMDCLTMIARINIESALQKYYLYNKLSTVNYMMGTIETFLMMDVMNNFMDHKIRLSMCHYILSMIKRNKYTKAHAYYEKFFNNYLMDIDDLDGDVNVSDKYVTINNGNYEAFIEPCLKEKYEAHIYIKNKLNEVKNNEDMPDTQQVFSVLLNKDIVENAMPTIINIKFIDIWNQQFSNQFNDMELKAMIDICAPITLKLDLINIVEKYLENMKNSRIKNYHVNCAINIIRLYTEHFMNTPIYKYKKRFIFNKIRRLYNKMSNCKTITDNQKKTLDCVSQVMELDITDSTISKEKYITHFNNEFLLN